MLNHLYGEIATQRTKDRQNFCKLQMKVNENSFIIEHRYNDLSSKLDALCKTLRVKIEKQDGYTVVDEREQEGP